MSLAINNKSQTTKIYRKKLEKALNLNLKEERDRKIFSSNGREFQTEEVAFVNNRPPKVLRSNLGSKSKSFLEDRKILLGVKGYMSPVM